MLMVILGVVALVVFVYYCIVRPLNYWRDRGVTHAKATWIFGHTLGVLIHRERWIDLIQKLYNDSPGTRYTGMFSFNEPLLVIKDTELIKQLAIKDFDHFTDHSSFLPPDSDPLFEKNLFSLKGRKWREMRNLLSPCFTRSKLQSMFGLMLESAENFVQYFIDKDEETVLAEMKDTFSRFSTDVIATTACGIKVNSLTEPENEFYLMGQEAVDFGNIWKNIKIVLYGLMPSIRKVLKVQVFSDEVSTFFRNLIYETIYVREEKGVVRPDMIQLLLEARNGTDKQNENNPTDSVQENIGTSEDSSHTLGNEKEQRTLSNEDITAQALVFFIAGFDSVSSLMCFATYELALNQDIQERLREEIRSTWKACDGKLTYDALTHMKYLDMVLSESLRKWPNAISIDRTCTKPYTIEPTLPGERPIHLKKGDNIWLPIFSIHRDPNYYPEPDRFDPERFSEENKGNIIPCSYLPFGLGPRICIGFRFALLETKLVIFHTLLNFEVVPVEKTSIPMKISKKTFTLNSEDGFWIGLKRIKRKH